MVLLLLKKKEFLELKLLASKLLSLQLFHRPVRSSFRPTRGTVTADCKEIVLMSNGKGFGGADGKPVKLFAGAVVKMVALEALLVVTARVPDVAIEEEAPAEESGVELPEAMIVPRGPGAEMDEESCMLEAITVMSIEDAVVIPIELVSELPSSWEDSCVERLVSPEPEYGHEQTHAVSELADTVTMWTDGVRKLEATVTLCVTIINSVMLLVNTSVVARKAIAVVTIVIYSA